jgi:hypothetical protein
LKFRLPLIKLSYCYCCYCQLLPHTLPIYANDSWLYRSCVNLFIHRSSEWEKMNQAAINSGGAIFVFREWIFFYNKAKIFHLNEFLEYMAFMFISQ